MLQISAVCHKIHYDCVPQYNYMLGSECLVLLRVFLVNNYYSTFVCGDAVNDS